MSEIKAIEKLRRLLDERGIEWTYADGTVSFANNERWFHAWAYNDGVMCVSMGYLTPEQAIAATLGSGTCRIEERNGGLYCDACGEMVGTCDPASELFIDGNAVELWNYCPNCGAKVVDE